MVKELAMKCLKIIMLILEAEKMEFLNDKPMDGFFSLKAEIMDNDELSVNFEHMQLHPDSEVNAITEQILDRFFDTSETRDNDRIIHEGRQYPDNGFFGGSNFGNDGF